MSRRMNIKRKYGDVARAVMPAVRIKRITPKTCLPDYGIQGHAGRNCCRSHGFKNQGRDCIPLFNEIYKVTGKQSEV